MDSFSPFNELLGCYSKGQCTILKTKQFPTWVNSRNYSLRIATGSYAKFSAPPFFFLPNFASRPEADAQLISPLSAGGTTRWPNDAATMTDEAVRYLR